MNSWFPYEGVISPTATDGLPDINRYMYIDGHTSNMDVWHVCVSKWKHCSVNISVDTVPVTPPLEH